MKEEKDILTSDSSVLDHASGQESQKTKDLGTKPIGSLLLQYSLPAVIAMLVNAIYNIVDRVFVGQFAGEDALAGLTISFPVMMIIFAFASLVGIGGATLMSIRLGEKDHRGASHVFGNTLGFGTIITGITLITIFINLDGILRVFGAEGDVLPYAMGYMRIILAGFIFQMIAFILNSAVRTEGYPLLSMIAMMSSAITNIILDFIFIRNFGWGVEGAALATIIGQFVGLMILTSFYIRGKSSFRLKLKDLVPEWKVMNGIFSIGVATFITTIGTSVSMTFLNRGLLEYGGNPAITAMGAINSLFTLFIMPIMGLQQGMQPIIGYNYGAKLRDRVYKTLKIGLTVAIGFSSFVFIIMQVFPVLFISLFLDPASATVKIATDGLRIFILMLPLLSINLLGIAFFQSIAKGKISMILGSLRQFVFLIPMVLILPNFMGLTGVWIATPIADGLAILITTVVLVKTYLKDQQVEKLEKNKNEQTSTNEVIMEA
jgi:putative MATE family efflux protein